MNPYDPVASVDDSASVVRSDSSLEWEGHRFSITAEQIPQSLWLVALVKVQVDEDSPIHFVKWRWNKRASWLFLHQGRSLVAKLHCSGANLIHCQLFIEDIEAGSINAPCKHFALGLVTVAIFTVAILVAVANFQFSG